MEIKKILTKINDNFSDFTNFFISYKKNKAIKKDCSLKDFIITKEDLNLEMISYYYRNIKNKSFIIENSNKILLEEINESIIEKHINSFLDLMFDDV